MDLRRVRQPRDMGYYSVPSQCHLWKSFRKLWRRNSQMHQRRSWPENPIGFCLMYVCYRVVTCELWTGGRYPSDVYIVKWEATVYKHLPNTGTLCSIGRDSFVKKKFIGQVYIWYLAPVLFKPHILSYVLGDRIYEGFHRVTANRNDIFGIFHSKLYVFLKVFPLLRGCT